MTLKTFASGAVPLATFMPARKTSLGDTEVNANGSTVNPAEVQTQVSFALNCDAAISADMTGALSPAVVANELQFASELIAACAHSTRV